MDVADKSVGEWYHFLTAAVAPRPIAWVTTVNEDGSVNAAPFSWFQTVSTKPPRFMLSFADKPGGEAKDTLRNAMREKSLVIQIVPPHLDQAMVNSSANLAGSEVESLGLETEPFGSGHRLTDCPVAFSCKVHSTTRFEGEGPTTMLICEATDIWADPETLDDFGNYKGDLLARMGGKEYTTTNERFRLDVDNKE